MARRVFYSFHYKPDSSRAAQIRNIGAIEGNRPATDNDWEAVKKDGVAAIRKWIADQIKGRSCTIVLVGKDTAKRKWIKHEIIQSWNKGMGVVGIRIHGLRDLQGDFSDKGRNPFELIRHVKSGKKLSAIVKCYNPVGRNSKKRYAWISEHLETVVEEAISIRSRNRGLIF